MTAEPVPLQREDVIKTYRYLRIGMIGAVALLGASIVIENGKVDCLQTSISAYYYTPVRAIFVGSMMAVGLSLIVYKGRGGFEDVCLNFAGMLAPVVAIAPTTDIGRCWSVAPNPLPVKGDGSVAEWVVININNNFYGLLIAGGIGLAVAAVIAIVANRDVLAPVREGAKGTRLSLFVTAMVLLSGWWLIENRDDFNTRAHGFAAALMFALLTVAIIANVVEQWERRRRRWSFEYLVVAGMMIVGAILIPWTRVFGDHTVFALEAWEIVLFAAYWLVQTAESWKENVTTSVGA